MVFRRGVKIARQVIRIERDALSDLLLRIDARFERACELILKSKGRVVVTGMGKPGFIAQKVSATLSSTGTPSLFLHPAEALHGDLGRVMKEDVVIAFSNSGQTEELVKLLPLIRRIGARLISFTGNPKSILAKSSDVALDTRVKKEACPLNLAPTASTTVMLALGDALALELLERKGFKAEDFAFYHPAGNLGRKLTLKVSDIMRRGRDNPIVPETMRVREVLLRITRARAGSATVVDKKGHLKGIFTDGDLRRHLKDETRILGRPVSEVMTRGPVTAAAGGLAAQALQLLRARKIDELPVVDARRRPVGLLDVQDLLKAGIV
ncbi:MAG: KpsF/GutQ family sugar-phosphate isomerase [Candidatus Omnitrophica bacterium]|nr:KpsF/GutQ family sugar-phosphate isomerase [Candidatus Omnitrophota bacterium]